jgi:hypothetical protein
MPPFWTPTLNCLPTRINQRAGCRRGPPRSCPASRISDLTGEPSYRQSHRVLPFRVGVALASRDTYQGRRAERTRAGGDLLRNWLNWGRPNRHVTGGHLTHTSASHVAAKGGDSVSTLAIGQLPYRAFSSSCPDSGRSAALATSANRISSGTENRDTGPIEEKSPLAVRSGPSRGYTSGGPVGPTGESPDANMRLRAVGGGPIPP